LALWIIYWIFKLITGKEGMGYGDFKLLAALGAWFGWQALPMIILLSSLVGAIVGIALMAVQGRSRQAAIPFGPYLAGAGLITLFFGPQLASLIGARL
jgi:leader peptidase (prepilin peptidase)/N-methyltransferase